MEDAPCLQNESVDEASKDMGRDRCGIMQPFIATTWVYLMRILFVLVGYVY